MIQYRKSADRPNAPQPINTKGEMDKNQLLKDLNKRASAKFKGERLLFGQGNLNASVVVVAEFPVSEDVHAETPLAGPAGKIFNQALRGLGLSRRQLYITYAVKSAPAPGVIPSPKEVKQFSQFLKEEIKIIDPKLTIALGSVALRGLSVKLPLFNIRGRLIRFGINSLFATHNPATILKSDAQKLEFEKDFGKLNEALASISLA